LGGPAVAGLSLGGGMSGLLIAAIASAVLVGVVLLLHRKQMLLTALRRLRPR
jgi:hypothetical protein